jgi:hypothetical protein
MIRQMALEVTDGLQQRGRHAEPMLGSFGCPRDRGGTGPVTGAALTLAGTLRALRAATAPTMSSVFSAGVLAAESGALIRPAAALIFCEYA